MPQQPLCLWVLIEGPKAISCPKGILNCSPIILGKSASGRLIPSSLVRFFLFTPDQSIHSSILLPAAETVCFSAASHSHYHHHHKLLHSQGRIYPFSIFSSSAVTLPHSEVYCNLPQYLSLISEPRHNKVPVNILTHSPNRVYPPLALVSSTVAARRRGRPILFVTPLT